MSKQKQEWMTVKEAHERSGYSTNIIYGLMRRKRVKSRKKNNMYEIEINSLIRDRKKESTASGLQRTREKKQMGEKR